MQDRQRHWRLRGLMILERAQHGRRVADTMACLVPALLVLGEKARYAFSTWLEFRRVVFPSCAYRRRAGRRGVTLVFGPGAPGGAAAVSARAAAAIGSRRRRTA